MSLHEGSNRLRGPVGSKLSLTVVRGSAADLHEVALVREASSDPAPTWRTGAPGVAIVRVPSLVGEAVAAVKARIDEAVRNGAQRLVVDLRATAEGPIENGLALARLFVASGTLAQWEVRGQSAQAITAGAGDGAVTLPTVVLVSAGTAGAAEVFAAALSGNERADLVGEHTIGRAGSQKLVKFTDGSGLLLTSGRYLTPAGEPIQGMGLEPDERVDQPDVEFGEAPPAGDPMLERAIEHLQALPAAA
jgi:carboxyl-terminal processing protease